MNFALFVFSVINISRLVTLASDFRQSLSALHGMLNQDYYLTVTLAAIARAIELASSLIATHLTIGYL